ncbi:MAG TPA: glycosyltransferase family 39 protein, partial [Gemmatimonadaceae bacterium]|nr:glycosyltransferase family 39 protein [Gemmatimonadaceae bacterium]
MQLKHRLPWTRDLARATYAKWRDEPIQHRLVLLFLAVVALAARIDAMRSILRFDERTTYYDFVKQPWSYAISAYPIPNNHVFHTLLAKASIAVLGDSIWALRLPALLAGLLIVPATYVAVRMMYRSPAAIIATAIVATSREMVRYSTDARGYSIVTLAFLLLIIVGARLQEENATEGWVVFAIIAALGLWTIPLMLLPLGTVAVWLLAANVYRRQWSRMRHLALGLGLTGLLTLLLYLPIIAREGLGALTHNEFVVPSTWTTFFTELSLKGVETLDFWTVGVPHILSVVLCLGVVVAMRWHADVSRQPVDVPFAAFVWCSVFFLLNPRAPSARMWLWLIPVVA